MENDGLIESIKQATSGLIYISEIDADITPFAASDDVESIDDILASFGNGERVEERDFEEFCNRLTMLHAWFGDAQKEKAKRFQKLFQLMKNNLRQIKVYRIGITRLEIFVVGVDSSNRIVGFRTRAVET